MLCQRLGHENGAMLPARAPERHHQILEASAEVVTDTGIDQRGRISQKPMHRFFLLQVLDHRRVPARLAFESRFATRILQATAVEYESSTVAGLVCGQSAAIRETENFDREVIGRRCEG